MLRESKVIMWWVGPLVGMLIIATALFFTLPKTQHRTPDAKITKILVGSGSFQVPPGVFQLNVTMAAGGGGGASETENGQPGGDATFYTIVAKGGVGGLAPYGNGQKGETTTATISVSPGEIFSYSTGEGGGGGPSGAGNGGSAAVIVKGYSNQ
jgi:hypothetical protein